MTVSDFQPRLLRRARLAGVTLDQRLAPALESYFRLLAAWNARVNLTGLDLRDPSPEAIDRLLVEPLAAARHVDPAAVTMLDIGSGGGSPAIPLALALPRLRLRMVEARIRKSVFLREAVRILRLDADVVADRYEGLLSRPELLGAQDLVVVRAVRLDSSALATLRQFARPGAQLFLFGTADRSDEYPDVPGLSRVGVHPLLDSLRSQLIVMQRDT